MKLSLLFAVLIVAVIIIAGCGAPKEDVVQSKADVSASLEKSTIKDGGTTGLVMTAKNTGTATIVGSFEVIPEDANLITITYESRKDFTLAPGESITKRYTIVGHTTIKASEVLLAVNLSSPGIGGYVSLGNAQVALRIEK
jgi:hypothetical protein